MGIFHLEPTSIAEWQSLVAEAEIATGYTFDAQLESYLVLMLDHYIQHGEIASLVVAFNFLDNSYSTVVQRGAHLRALGDQCLLLSGLFPERALRKNVSLDYFIGIGQQAYQSLTTVALERHFDAALYQNLSDNFVGLMDLLNAMRTVSNSSSSF